MSVRRALPRGHTVQGIRTEETPSSKPCHVHACQPRPQLECAGIIAQQVPQLQQNAAAGVRSADLNMTKASTVLSRVGRPATVTWLGWPYIAADRRSCRFKRRNWRSTAVSRKANCVRERVLTDLRTHCPDLHQPLPLHCWAAAAPPQGLPSCTWDQEALQAGVHYLRNSADSVRCSQETCIVHCWRTVRPRQLRRGAHF